MLQLGVVQADFYSKDDINTLTKTIEPRWSYIQTKALIEVVRDTLKTYKVDLLSKIEAFKSGVLPPNPLFPLIYVTGETDEVDRMFTSANVDNRTLNIMLITKFLDGEEAMFSNIELADTVVDILYANQYFGGRVMHIDPPVVDYGQLELNGNTMYATSINLTTKSAKVLA
jgi:hypothetical protein